MNGDYTLGKGNTVLQDIEQLIDLKIENLKGLGFASMIDKATSFIQDNMGTNFIKAKQYASHPSSTPEILKELSVYPSERIRKLVFNHENTATSTMQEMYENKENTFVTPLEYLMNDKIKGDMLTKALHDTPSFNLVEVLDRDLEDIPFDVLKYIAFTGAANYWSQAEGSMPVDDIAKEMILDKITSFHDDDLSWELNLLLSDATCDLEVYAIATHPKVPPEVLNLCIDRIKTMGISEKDFISPETGKPLEYNRFAEENLEMLDFSTENRPLITTVMHKM